MSSDVPEAPENDLADLNGLWVLIVKDSWSVGTGLQKLLESRGANVMGPAATAAEAERLIA